MVECNWVLPTKGGPMLFFILVLAASLVLATFFGHIIHWSLHQRWTGPAHRGHMEHHLELYPPTSLVSNSYKAAKWHHRGPVLFTPAFLVILGATWGLTSALSVPLWVTVTFGVTMLVFGLFNDFVHDSFHVENHILQRVVPDYDRMRERHFIHHCNMRRNFGIVSFVWDIVFGTFKE